MAWAFHAFVRVVRRSPNVYSFIGGWFLILGVPVLVVLTLVSGETAKRNNIPLAPVLAAISEVGDYLEFNPGYFAVPMAVVVIVGFIMVLAGITRAFRPRES